MGIARMAIIHCTILGQPVPKARPRFSSRSGTAYTPKKTKDYEKKIVKVIQPVVKDKISGAVHVNLNVIFNRPKYMQAKKYQEGLILHTKRPDLDNVIKAVLDALNSVLDDDAQVAKITATKYYAEKQGYPRTEITISKL